MPKRRLHSEDVDFIIKMKKVKYSNCEIAEKLGITEGAVRYRLKRCQSETPDRRKQKLSGLTRFDNIIKLWLECCADDCHRPAFKLLYERLRESYGYQGSYDAVRRYLRKHYGQFCSKRVKIRIETPPGALLQVDWKEDIAVQIGRAGNWVKLQALVFVLCFSRKTVVQFSEKKNFESFISCHQSAFVKFGGLPEMIRPDCLKSAITRWQGGHPVVNERYSKYLSRLGVEVFPSRPGTPTDKGKVEKRIRDFFDRLEIRHRVYGSIKELQERADAKLSVLELEWRSGATGLNVKESFRYEQEYLKSLPEDFPQLPVVEKRTRVRLDGTVFFCKNYYQVGCEYRDKNVLCINTGSEITIHHDGEEIGRYPYLPGAVGMVNLSQKALNNLDIKISEKVLQWALEVSRRQVEIYQEIIGGIR
jgi:transposase